MPRSAFTLRASASVTPKCFCTASVSACPPMPKVVARRGIRSATMVILVVVLPTSMISTVEVSPAGRSARAIANVSSSSARTETPASSNTDSVSSIILRAKPTPTSFSSPFSARPVPTTSNTVSDGGRGTSSSRCCSTAIRHSCFPAPDAAVSKR